MLRLIISFALALVCHFYIFQYNLNRDNSVSPQLVSDSSVTVSLNQNLVKKVNNSQRESTPKERVISENHLTPPISEDNQSVDKLKDQPLPYVKSQVRKTKMSKKKQAIVEKSETAPKVEHIKIQESKRSLSKPSNSVVVPVSGSDHDAKADNKSSSKTTTSAVIKARPLYQYNPKPVYPDLARRRGWEGVVTLLVQVTKKGDVSSIQLHASCGYKILDKAALKAVATWCFIPGSNDGKVAASTIMIPIHFKLN